MLGSQQIKKIFAQVNTESSWSQPWRSMYYRCIQGDHWYDSDSDPEDLYDSDDYKSEKEDSFDLLCKFESSQLTPSNSHSSLDSWMEQIDYPGPQPP